MENKADEISSRLLDYGVSIIRLQQVLETTNAGKHIFMQLLRSGTSVGANYEEARCAESRNDFLHKLQICLKECKESLYWLRLLKQSQLIDNSIVSETLDEGQQIAVIIGSSVRTAKNNR